MASIAPATVALPASGHLVRPASRFYVRMAALCIGIALIGFAPTYWVPLLRGTLDVPPLTHVAVTLLPALVNDLLIAAVMIYDRRTRGRVHPAYWWGAAAVVAVQILRVPLSTSHAWMRVTDFLLASP